MVLSELGYLLWERMKIGDQNVSEPAEWRRWNFLGACFVGLGHQNGHQLPRAARLFPQALLAPHCLIEGWVLAIPLLLYDFRIYCCGGLWPGKSQGHAGKSVWSLTLYTGFPITTAWPCPCEQNTCDYSTLFVNIICRHVDVWLKSADDKRKS